MNESGQPTEVIKLEDAVKELKALAKQFPFDPALEFEKLARGESEALPQLLRHKRLIEIQGQKIYVLFTHTLTPTRTFEQLSVTPKHLPYEKLEIIKQAFFGDNKSVLFTIQEMNTDQFILPLT